MNLIAMVKREDNDQASSSRQKNIPKVTTANVQSGHAPDILKAQANQADLSFTTLRIISRPYHIVTLTCINICSNIIHII